MTAEQETNWTAFVDECGGLQEAADKAGITYDAMRLRRSKQRRRAERGALGYGLGLPGMATRQISAKDGDVWVKQTKAAGEVYELPTGQRIKGVSALVDAEGREVAKWIKSDRDASVAAFSIDSIKEALSSITPRLPIVRPTVSQSALLTDYILGDHHLGLLAWKPETGTSYDLKIGEKLLVDKMDELVGRTQASETAIFTNLGDFFHSNSSKNETAKGTLVDVDGRYGKVLQVGLKLAVACIERLLAKHEKVIVCWLRGNHDPEIAMAAALALWAWFRNEPRVELNFNPSKFFVHQFGKTMLFKTHGDELKPERAALFAATEWPKMWGDTIWRYADFGHVHHYAKGGTAGSMIWRSYETIAAKDAWHAGKGYQSGRSMTANVYHNASGWYGQTIVSVA